MEITLISKNSEDEFTETVHAILSQMNLINKFSIFKRNTEKTQKGNLRKGYLRLAKWNLCL